MAELMAGWKALIPAVAFIIMSVVVQAAEIESEAIIEENGNTIVIMKISGNGTVEIPLQEDVQEVRVKGALYIMENGTLEVSVGSTQAAVLYTTSLLTSKENDTWRFSMRAPENTVSITAALPAGTILLGTAPAASVNSSGFLTLFWGAINSASADYTFKKPPLEEPVEDIVEVGVIGEPKETATEKAGENGSGQPDFTMTAIVAIIIASGCVFYIFQKRAVQKTEAEGKAKGRENIMKTLSENQRKAVETLLENSGSMRRSILEAKAGLGKSSLALALRDLEKKNIVTVDRTFSAHIVKLTEWFNEQ